MTTIPVSVIRVAVVAVAVVAVAVVAVAVVAVAVVAVAVVAVAVIAVAVVAVAVVTTITITSRRARMPTVTTFAIIAVAISITITITITISTTPGRGDRERECERFDLRGEGDRELLLSLPLPPPSRRSCLPLLPFAREISPESFFAFFASFFCCFFNDFAILADSISFFNAAMRKGLSMIFLRACQQSTLRRSHGCVSVSPWNAAHRDYEYPHRKEGELTSFSLLLIANNGSSRSLFMSSL
jgi:hypothetical protein